MKRLLLNVSGIFVFLPIKLQTSIRTANVCGCSNAHSLFDASTAKRYLRTIYFGMIFSFNVLRERTFHFISDCV